MTNHPESYRLAFPVRDDRVQIPADGEAHPRLVETELQLVLNRFVGGRRRGLIAPNLRLEHVPGMLMINDATAALRIVDGLREVGLPE